ncbi:MAG: cupredoxin domain-containing protein [Herpetosiphon sp.]|nr:cupredoxin domain-containing protein [Herpetosiphon sp.]
MKKILSLGMLLVLSLTLIACGGDSTSPTTAPASGGTAATTAPAAGAAKLTVDTADAATLAYAQTSLEAPAGDIEVTFNNKGALPHNIVIVKPGEEDAAVADAVANAPAFTPKTAVAMGTTIEGGKSETFTAKLDAGTYSYICTYPGHYAAGMKGTLVVK